MPAAKPSSYTWLTDESFPLGVAGCITVAAGQNRQAVADAFGADLSTAVSDPGLNGDYAAFAVADAAVIAVEDNGYQGTRAAVLTGVSKASANGKAASVAWNVEGEVTFACAAKGKLVAYVEIGAGDQAEELPRSLRRLYASAEDESANLVVVAAAMVATYTATSFTRADLAEPFQWHELTPPLDLLPTMTVDANSLINERDYGSGYGSEPLVGEAISAIAAAEPIDQRRLAERVVAATMAQVAPGHPRFAPIVEQFGGAEPAEFPSSAIVYLQNVERIVHKANMRSVTGGDGWPFPDRSMYRATQIWRLGIALRYACHSDPATAAWESIYQARMVLRLIAQFGGTDAGLGLYQAALQFLEDPQMTQDDFNSLLPPPLEPGAIDAALAAERAEYESERADYEEVWGPNRADYGPVAPFDLPS